MVAYPPDTPVAIPVLPTVATPVLLLLHVPPDEASVRFSLAPVHNVVVPDINDTSGSTVTTTIARQPLDSVYDIAAVPPVTPVTRPVYSLT